MDSIAGKLPNGLTLDSSAGTIPGTPSKRGTYTFTIRGDGLAGRPGLGGRSRSQINRP